VETAGWNVEDIAALHRVPSEERRDITPAGESLRNLCCRHTWVTSKQNLGARCRLENDPRFVFTNCMWAVNGSCQLIVWVHLNREALLHIEKFDEHTIGTFVGITEPCLPNRAARHIRHS
jgi:hypothetical protein